MPENILLIPRLLQTIQHLNMDNSNFIIKNFYYRLCLIFLCPLSNCAPLKKFSTSSIKSPNYASSEKKFSDSSKLQLKIIGDHENLASNCAPPKRNFLVLKKSSNRASSHKKIYFSERRVQKDRIR